MQSVPSWNSFYYCSPFCNLSLSTRLLSEGESPKNYFYSSPNLSIVGFLICILNLGLICFRKNEICLLIKAMESVIEWKKIEKISQSSHVLWITLHYFYYEIKLQNKYIIRIYVNKLLQLRLQTKCRYNDKKIILSVDM